MSKLSAAARKSLPTSDFAVKSKAATPSGKATGGSYPINDPNHAKNALARSSGKPVAGEVRAAVAKKYPGMVKKSASAYTPDAKRNAANITKKMSNKSKAKTEIGF